MPVLAGVPQAAQAPLRPARCAEWRDVREVIIARCGHYPAEKRPAELAAAFDTFLEETSAPAA